jgi:hypothetical protein
MRSIAVLDPLCGACKGFERRLLQSGLASRLDLHTVLMPLDKSCNWMVKDSLHPGSCLVSEAMLCDREHATQILDYAFAHQQKLMDMARSSESQLRQHLNSQFPSTKGCLGTPQGRNLLTKSLRWAVANAIPVLTPQLFIGERRVCDEDTDLGLEYTVAQMLQQRSGARR